MAKEKKMIKIGIFQGTLSDFIALGIMLLLIIFYFVSPKAYSVTTAMYNKGSEQDQQNVVTALGEENTEQDFAIYFQWYNVVHELGHGLIRYNSKTKIDSVEEEQLVNDFAVAYWIMYGEAEKIERLEKIANHASANIQSDSNGMNYIDFAKENWGQSSFNTFNNYGWFQFTSVSESLKNKRSLDEVLQDMGISGYTLPENPEKLVYPTINEDVSTQVINDAVANMNSWGLVFPEVHHHFSKDPNSNFSRPVKNMILFDFPAFT